ncbi:hypothetical protein KM043_003571 [Ampulex compressa]|nr:hypothetical protein KM043_003571 [Ampulex compressa]
MIALGIWRERDPGGARTLREPRGLMPKVWTYLEYDLTVDNLVYCWCPDTKKKKIRSKQHRPPSHLKLFLAKSASSGMQLDFDKPLPPGTLRREKLEGRVALRGGWRLQEEAQYPSKWNADEESAGKPRS